MVNYLNTKLWSFKVRKLDVCVRLLFGNPVTYYQYCDIIVNIVKLLRFLIIKFHSITHNINFMISVIMVLLQLIYCYRDITITLLFQMTIIVEYRPSLV